MKRFSRRSFSQIMVNNSLKNELWDLKEQIQTSCTVSYGDVIFFLLDKYKQKQIINKKSKKKLEFAVKPGLYVSFPLKKQVVNVSTKLESKKLVSYTV